MNKLIKVNEIRKKLSKNEASIGTWLQIPHPSIAEILGDANYDWVVVDLEHGSISLSDLPNLFRALELGNTLPLARLPSHDVDYCKRVLDAGAGGVVVPMIESAEQISNIINSSRWPPSGTRGVGYSRANMFGKKFLSYKKEAQRPLIIAQIEHINAIKNLKKIISVKGLDAVFLGPYDLSASMGITGNFENEKFKNTIDIFLKICNQNKFPAGIHIINPIREDLFNKVKEGFRFIAFSIDAVFISKYSMNPMS